MNFDLFSAFLIGLMGSTHCIGMCGGVSSALSLSAQGQSSTRFIFLYNLGRTGSYALAGALVGLFSQSIMQLSPNLPLILKVFSGVFLVMIGLHIARWWSGVTQVEKLGGGLWQQLKKLNKHIFPVDSATKALLYGVVWGWLPCGLVYNTLTWSIASGDMVQGALIMMMFGFGTMPAMLLLGVSAKRVQPVMARKDVRIGTALILIGWGLFTIYKAWMMNGMMMHHH